MRLGERHTTVDMMTFLYSFHRTGAPPPHEFICDGANVLLNAATIVYSPYRNIEEYAEKIKDSDSCQTRIRMDGAHFTNTYKKHLKGANRRVRCLYMAAMGQLIMTEDIAEAREIIKAIFLLSKCETAGINKSGEVTECQKSMNWLKNFVTGIFITYSTFIYLTRA